MIVTAGNEDLTPAINCLRLAFVDDAHMKFFFKGDRRARQAMVEEFFTILLTVRLALDMPVLVSKRSSGIDGIVMGYDTRRIEWPKPYTDRWNAFFQSQDGLKARLETANSGSNLFKKAELHYYLGAIAVDPERQGQGIGSELIAAFCDLSDRDQASHGVFLETGEEQNVKYYQARSFKLLGQSDMDDQSKLYCLYNEKRKHEPLIG